VAVSTLQTTTSQKANNATPGSGAESPSKTLQPANAEFEQLVKGPALETKKENRGGIRPGAGRPMGMGDDLAAVNRLAEKPNELICDCLELPFDLWADVNNIPDLALTKEEARRLGLPVTQLMEYYFPGKIPVIAWAWMNLGASLVNVLKKRIKLIRQRKAAGKAANGGGAGGLPTSQPSTPGSKSSDMVPPAIGHIRVK
jgi:hypothetical protein